MPGITSIVQGKDGEILYLKLAQSESRNSNTIEVGEHEEKQNDERVEVIELTLKEVMVINSSQLLSFRTPTPGCVLNYYKTDLLYILII